METQPLPSRSRSSEMETEPLPSRSSLSEMETEPLPLETEPPPSELLPSSPKMETEPLPCPSSGKKPSRLTYCVVFWPYYLNLFTMAIMTTYLTDVWNLSITRAAAIVNLYSGISGIMPACTALIADRFRGSYFMLWVSRFAFICGFGLLTMSTPPVLAVVTGSCSSFVPQCIGVVHKILFNTALLLLAIGVSTHLSSVPQFKEDQFPSKKRYKACSCHQFSFVTLMFVVPGCAVLAVGMVQSWFIRFGIGALSTVVSTLIFLSGLYSYKRPSGCRSRLAGIFIDIYGCNISTFVMVLISMAFVLSGVISSIGSTFFMEQATDMNHYIGRLKVPPVILPMLQELMKLVLKIPVKASTRTDKFALPGILVSSVISILCCVTAAKVETRRLDTVKSHGFIDNPKETIPMTMFWLVPQFLLLGLAEQIGRHSIVKLFCFRLDDECMSSLYKRSKEKYTETLADSLSGVGIIGGVLSVYAVGKTKPSWFQDTLNHSRLDNYYWTLAALAAATLVSSFSVLLLVSLCRRFCAPHKRIPALLKLAKRTSSTSSFSV